MPRRKPTDLTPDQRAALVAYYARIIATSKSPDRIARAAKQLAQLQAGT